MRASPVVPCNKPSGALLSKPLLAALSAGSFINNHCIVLHFLLLTFRAFTPWPFWLGWKQAPSSGPAKGCSVFFTLAPSLLTNRGRLLWLQWIAAKCSFVPCVGPNEPNYITRVKATLGYLITTGTDCFIQPRWHQIMYSICVNHFTQTSPQDYVLLLHFLLLWNLIIWRFLSREDAFVMSRRQRAFRLGQHLVLIKPDLCVFPALQRNILGGVGKLGFSFPKAVRLPSGSSARLWLERVIIILVIS